MSFPAQVVDDEGNVSIIRIVRVADEGREFYDVVGNSYRRTDRSHYLKLHQRAVVEPLIDEVTEEVELAIATAEVATTETVIGDPGEDTVFEDIVGTDDEDFSNGDDDVDVIADGLEEAWSDTSAELEPDDFPEFHSNG